MNIRTVTYNDFTFIDVHDPQEFELKFLRHNYKFDEVHLEDFINKQQVPKIEIEKEYALIVLDFPHLEGSKEEKKHDAPTHHNGDLHAKKPLAQIIPTPPIPHFSFGNTKKHRIRTGHVSFFIKEKFLVVLHDDRTPQIDEIFTECQKTLKNREEFLGLGGQYLFYRIVDLLVDSSFTTLNSITATIDKIDQHLLDDNPAEKVVEDISSTRRNIVVFQTMIKPALTIFSDLENGKYEGLNGPMTSSWSNVRDHMQKIWYRLEDSRELIEGIAISHESLLTARTNEIVKVLTMFTAILLPLTLLASVYGMNIVGLPYAQQNNSLTIVVGIMVVLALVMLVVFKLRRWL